MNPRVLLDALSVLQSTQAGTAAQMGYDDTPGRNFGRDLWQPGRHIFVRQAMKAVSLNLSVADFPGQRNQFRDGRPAPVKTGVETGNLRYMGQPLHNGLNRCQVVRLMQRGQRHQSI